MIYNIFLFSVSLMIMMTNPKPAAAVDPYEFLGIVLNPDGTLTRNLVLPVAATSSDPTSPVLSKDINFHQSRNCTSARIFLPREAAALGDHQKKLPLVVYFHGGGFILCSVANTIMHDYCFNLSMRTPVVIVSVEYRLSPEHRLPAAYDDAVETLHWITTSDDEWVTKFADLSNVFLMGISAGGNIAYNAGLRAAKMRMKKGLKIRGLILQQPYFGGVKRTRSEMDLVNDTSLPLSAADLMWNLSLPLGADRDHEYCNPILVGQEGQNTSLEKIKELGWEVMVSGYEGDPLYDREVEFANRIEANGIRLLRQFHKGGYHGIELFDPSKTTEMAITLRRLAATERNFHCII